MVGRGGEEEEGHEGEGKEEEEGCMMVFRGGDEESRGRVRGGAWR